MRYPDWKASVVPVHPFRINNRYLHPIGPSEGTYCIPLPIPFRQMFMFPSRFSISFFFLSFIYFLNLNRFKNLSQWGFFFLCTFVLSRKTGRRRSLWVLIRVLCSGGFSCKFYVLIQLLNLMYTVWAGSHFGFSELYFTFTAARKLGVGATFGKTQVIGPIVR